MLVCNGIAGGADEYPAQDVAVEPETGTLILQYNFEVRVVQKTVHPIASHVA